MQWLWLTRCHAAGFIRATGKRNTGNGKSRYHYGTLGKALGGAMGGYTAKKRNN
jgi:7-keto-8-aminopelargonate synthetase-like enzyme